MLPEQTINNSSKSQTNELDNKMLKDEKHISAALTEVKEYYRTGTAAFYLYQQIVTFSLKDKFNHDFLKLLYATLDAWNMNSRGAKLADFDTFRESVSAQKNSFMDLKDHTIEQLSENDFEVLKKLFSNLSLTQAKKPPLVTFAKTMHFMLPELIAPMDRKYTLNFFFKNTNVPNNHEKQFEIFKSVQTCFASFAKAFKLSKYVENETWNANIPKVIDNIIVGSMRLQKSDNV